jgi:hypothetical protein
MTGAPLPPPSPRRKRGKGFGAMGCGLLIIGIALFSSAMELFWTRLDERRFPWAYAKAGRSTLVGTWVGTLTSGGGHRRAVLFDIKLKPINFGSGRRRRRSSGRNNIIRRAGSEILQGSASLCGGAREQHFALSGSSAADGAARFRLSFSPSDSTPPNGLSPSFLRGAWDGRDSILFEADLYMREGVSAITGSDDPDTGRPATGAMRRGDTDAFRALCARSVAPAKRAPAGAQPR